MDTREFSKTLEQYLKLTKRDLADALNRVMFWILMKARELTPVASRDEILRDTGAEDIYKTGKKSGKTRRVGFALRNGSRNAFALLGYWAKKKGWKISKENSAEQAKKFVGRRLRSVNALRAGWNLAIRKFAKATNQVAKVGGAVKQRGSAQVAKPDWNPVAIAEYALVEKKAGGVQIDPRVEAALAAAFQAKTADMKVYIQRKMQERANSMK